MFSIGELIFVGLVLGIIWPEENSLANSKDVYQDQFHGLSFNNLKEYLPTDNLNA